MCFLSETTPPKFYIAPEKWWLEDYFPIGVLATFLELWKKNREGIESSSHLFLHFHLNLSSFLATFSNGRISSEILKFFPPHFPVSSGRNPPIKSDYISTCVCGEKFGGTQRIPLGFFGVFRTECSSSRFVFDKDSAFLFLSLFGVQNVRGAHFETQPFESSPPVLPSPPSTKTIKVGSTHYHYPVRVA